jgi:hypothetical protein
MISPEPQSDSDKHLKMMQSIFARMARVEWVTDPNPVNSVPWWNALTELGQRRVWKISDALIRFCPGAFKAEDLSVLTASSVRQPTPAEWREMLTEIDPMIAALQPPPFSADEADTLFSMFASFAHQHGKRLIPPFRGYRPPPV